MKSLTVALVLFLIIVGMIIANSFYVRNVCENMIDLCEVIPHSQANKKEAEALAALWQKHHPFLDLSINANELELMNEFVAGLVASVNAERPADIEKYCSLIIELCEEFKRHEGISLQSLA